jgi:hypothetical protein
MCYCEQSYLFALILQPWALLIKFGGLHARKLLRLALLVALVDNSQFP